MAEREYRDMETKAAQAAKGDSHCDADHAWLFRRDGELYRWGASYGHSKQEHERIKRHMLTLAVSPGRGGVVARCLLEGQPVISRTVTYRRVDRRYS
jgi:hypothetical protein